MKKFLFLLITLLLAGLPVSAQWITGGSVTQDEAIAFAQTQFQGKDVDYYIGDYSSAEWLVFIDEYPMKGWEHPCTYLYVGKTKSMTGIVFSKASAMRPPSGINLIPKAVKKRVTRAPLEIKVPKSTTTNSVNSHTYAVIISGGISKYSNYERYWNDCSFIYQTLINKYQIPKQNTYVVMSDGTNPAADMNCGGGTFKSSPLDLDFDNSPDIKYAATRANLTNIFNELSRKLTENDHLYIYVIDHGGTNDNRTQSYICLWNNENLQDYELSAMLDKIKAGSMNIVLGQCFSGGFIDNLQKKGRVISAACTGAQSSYACADNIPYDEFVYKWTSGVAGCTAYGVPVNADQDRRGHITMDEAFNYARDNDRRPETPMYSSQPLSVGEDLAFDKAPELIDLYIRDNAEDTGKEPNLTAGDVFWNSPDVWVRNEADGITEHENPYYTTDHRSVCIYVKVTNRGAKDYMGSGKYLHLYWAKASTGLTLKAWRGKELYNGYVTGEHLRANHLDEKILAGDSYTYFVDWVLPKDLIGSTSDNDTEHHHFCLFARVSDTPIDDDEGLYLRYNAVDILRSNKLAQKNLSIIRKSDTSNMTSTVFIRNTMDTSRKYTLEVRPHTIADGDLFTVAQVNMIFSQPILSAWNRGGSILAGVSYSPSINPRSFRLQSADSKIKGISLNKNEFEKISFQCNFNDYVVYSRNYSIDLIQRDEFTGEIIGGESFIINPTNSIWHPVTITTSEKSPGRYNLKIDHPEEVTDITWTDQSGNVIGNDSEVMVFPVKGNTKYKVSAVSKEESTLSQASITLDQAQGIKSVAPNYAMDYVDVVLKEPVSNTLTSVRIQSATNNQTIVQNVQKDHFQIRLELGQLPSGVLIIQLIDNNRIIDSSKILKN